ncbi:TonB-dependent receptor [Dinghuibacter silviterrae]|uniref:TonB-dependent receptor n=1 Tax=Dinghuibacter silviterrae TaxID=1539049 RepID=A0A4R8DHT8_9BACT|nr:TonB-dependent receptor [Dinghuibacter silviterrae]TDW96824.1 TonB-dependent receptor [Dinghuibacter silviterrae]
MRGIVPFVAGLFLWTLSTFLPTFSQAQDMHVPLVTLSAKGRSLKDIFREIEQKTGWTINYQDNVLDVSRKVDIQVTDVSLTTVMRQLLAGSQADFVIKGDMIVIIAKKEGAPQKTILKGRVVDFETAQPLPGATVSILETGETVASNEDGYYVFNHLQEGKVTLVVSYSGYQKTILPNVRLTGGRTETEDVKMPAGKVLTEVVVKAGVRHLRAVTHTTEKDLIGEIRNATGSVSGISSELISKTADRNAAEVVKKIAGVTVVDDRFIIVRGMNERYNLTYLNGNVAPSTELYDKAFAYDLLPSSVIDRILVYKSPVADMVADYAGAAIKVYTKNAMPVRHLDIGVQVAHRPGSTLSEVNSYTGGKYDFLGFDDGSRKLPSWSPSYFQSNKQAAVDQQTMVKGFSPILDDGQKQSAPDMQVYLNYYNAWRLGGQRRLYDLTSITYGHETRFYDIHRQTGNTYAYGLAPVFGIAAADALGANNQLMQSWQTTEIGKINALENLTLKWNPRNSLELQNFFINEGRVITTVNDVHDNILPQIDSGYGAPEQHTINLSFQQRLLYFGNLTGEHFLRKDSAQTLQWNIGYTYSGQNVPDQRNSTFYTGQYPNQIQGEPSGLGFITAGTNTGVLADGNQGMISRTFIKLKENVYNASLDYTLRLHHDFSLKAGTYQLFKLREVGRRIFLVNRGGLQPGETLAPPGSEQAYNGWPEGYGSNNPNLIFFRQQYLNTIWNPANFPNDGSGLGIYDVTNVTDSYVASEQNNAGYLMGDWNPLGKPITLNAGIRVEYDRQRLAGGSDNGMGANIVPILTDHKKTEVLPSVNLTWRPDTRWVLRAGYGRTVNRPEFRELTPYIDHDYQNNEDITGNPGLVSATIDNYDARVEFYPRSAAQNEVLNAGVFYKNLQDPIERLRISRNGLTDPGSVTQITYDNAASARIYGVEAEVKKNLFKNVSLLVNGALIKSTTVQRVLDINGYVRDTAVSVQGRPLQGQSPYVFNAGLFYENPGWGTKIGLTYNVSGPRIYAKSVANPHSNQQVAGADSSNFLSIRPDLLELARHLVDLSVSQRIVKSLVLKLSIQNILAQPFRIAEDYNYNEKYVKEQPVGIKGGVTNGNLDPNKIYYYYKGDDLFSKYNPGRYYLLQLTYAF